MRRTIMLLALTIVLGACGTTKTVSVSNKVIKGNWTLNTISYSKDGTYNVTLLNDVPKECFEGSKWQFVQNNNTGIYTISDSNCLTGARYFVFANQQLDKNTGLYDFLLKPTNKKHKSETKQGFRINLSALSETTMQWQQNVTVDGKPFIISMNFNKNK